MFNYFLLTTFFKNKRATKINLLVHYAKGTLLLLNIKYIFKLKLFVSIKFYIIIIYKFYTIPLQYYYTIKH